ncbi:MAG: type II toxin-antitoxin system PemK/MazF family toxin [Acaryochloridaceae cyanobacterium CSU_3_4]|nr:type II toxin-antitoxin system PemK/MazF family toxin [Leptolyngbyaceae cyanobacterium SU_3_3]NJN39557.1 type II toxin-antitoxin system PemK/MazF family toxin [Acaryochloridaceae cyanobacterium CSU_3_4]
MPKGKLAYQRGEIRWVQLDPTIGAEARKTRSCLIVQNDTMNQYGQLTVIIPFRPGSKQAPYAVNVKASSANGLDQDRFLDVGQIRALDSRRIMEHQGMLEDKYWQPIQTALNVVLGFD